MVNVKITGGEIEPVIEMSLSELVFDLKSNIEDKLDVRVHRQRLWYNDMELDNEKRIAFYAMCGDETITLTVNPLPPDVKLHVLVKHVGSDGYVRVRETDTVGELRGKVSRYWGISTRLITLSRLNVEMLDDRPLSAYYINEDSEVKLSVLIEPR